MEIPTVVHNLLHIKLSKEALRAQKRILSYLTKKEVTIILLNGFRIHRQIIAVDKFTILIKNNDKQQLIYKQAISTVAV
ncbi:RNA chaperone Hfq [Bacillus mycoides]|uniref:RNA chaperone Hfq n=1 Tax=Bacillus mycoides TaxID=1405 RepID=UPI0018CD944A|nr:RNA chaperone Hfq [Bacillus cereus]